MNLTVGLWASAPRSLLTIWMLVMIVFTVTRWLVARRFPTGFIGEQETRRWEKRFVVSAATSGILWGVAGGLFYTPDQPETGLFVALLIIGLSAAATLTLSYHRIACPVFLLPAVIPIMLHLMLDDIFVANAVGFVIPFYFTVLYLLSREIYRTAHESILGRINVAVRTRELEDANKRRVAWLENLASFLRHELKNAIVGVKTSLQLIERRAALETVVPYVARARTSVSDIGRLLDSVGKASTLEAAVYKEPKERVDLSHLVRTRIKEYSDIYPQQELLCECEAGVTVIGSTVSLTQALDNLVSNAVEHSREGAPIVVSLKQDREDAVLAVADEGDPLPEDKERIFELFVSLRSSGRKKATNIGLGLGLVRLITEAHGGQVTAADLSERPGALFTVVLPLLQ
jgi:signal transduction histidine kinase